MLWVTVMSNMVLEDLLGNEGIKVFRCVVTDMSLTLCARKKAGRRGTVRHRTGLDGNGDGRCAFVSKGDL